jgi:hypothetical protein
VVEIDRGRIELDGDALSSFSRIELARRIAVVQQLPEAPSTILAAPKTSSLWPNPWPVPRQVLVWCAPA